ncbi:hypothetical protein D9M69_512140 [compost metagenome]
MPGNQVQAEVEAGLGAAGAEQVAVLGEQGLSLQAHLWITFAEGRRQCPVGGGPATVEATRGGQQKRAAAEAGELLGVRPRGQPGQQLAVGRQGPFHRGTGGAQHNQVG